MKVFGDALATSLITVALLLAVFAVYQMRFHSPPVELNHIGPMADGALCPGEKAVIRSEVYVREPAVLFYYLSVMDESMSYNMTGTQVILSPRLHPISTRFPQLLHWSVPNLEPGNYILVLAVRGTDASEISVFQPHSFEIADCTL